MTSAVLTGALIVGDSVRQSLSHLVLDRLGEVESALMMERFVDESLASRLSESPSFQEYSVSAVPVIFLLGVLAIRALRDGLRGSGFTGWTGVLSDCSVPGWIWRRAKDKSFPVL